MAVVGSQYILPFFDNHFAPYFDYSQYSYEDYDREAEFLFSEWGISYFIKEKGKGLYISLSYSNLSYNANFMNVSLKNGSVGSGKGKVDLTTTNLRIGMKTGGTFYFRIEMGFGIGNLPKIVNFKATDNSNSNYTELASSGLPKIEGVNENRMLVGNLGIGLSF